MPASQHSRFQLFLIIIVARKKKSWLHIICSATSSFRRKNMPLQTGPAQSSPNRYPYRSSSPSYAEQNHKVGPALQLWLWNLGTSEHQYFKPAGWGRFYEYPLLFPSITSPPRTPFPVLLSSPPSLPPTPNSPPCPFPPRNTKEKTHTHTHISRMRFKVSTSVLNRRAGWGGDGNERREREKGGRRESMELKGQDTYSAEKLGLIKSQSVFHTHSPFPFHLISLRSPR